MGDIHPARADIIQADIAVANPFPEKVASLIILDPPYLRIADGKRYRNIGENIDQWLVTLRKIVDQIKSRLASDGALAVITDDVLRKNEHVPIAYRVTQVISEAGLIPCATIYNHNPNYIYSMGPAQMKAARVARLLCNGCKIIQIARANH